MRHQQNHRDGDDVVDAAFDPALVLYLADELEPAARAAFEGRLRADPSLQTRLADAASVDASLRSDASRHGVSALSTRAALNGTIRAVREQALLLKDRPAAAGRRVMVNLPRWVWRSAVAAVLVVGLVTWVSVTEPGATPAVNSSQGDGRGEWFATVNGLLPVPGEYSDDVGGEIESEIDILQFLSTMSSDVN